MGERTLKTVGDLNGQNHSPSDKSGLSYVAGQPSNQEEPNMVCKHVIRGGYTIFFGCPLWILTISPLRITSADAPPPRGGGGGLWLEDPGFVVQNYNQW